MICIFTFIAEVKRHTSLTQTPSIGNIKDSLMEDKYLGLCCIRFSEQILQDAYN